MLKEGYKNAFVGTASSRLPVDANGNIITNAEVIPGGSKTLAFNRANADNSADDNQRLFDIFSSFTDSSNTTTINTFTIKWEV